MNSTRNFQAMIEQRVPGDQRKVVIGWEKDLQDHFEKIKPEFCGLPMLCFHLAKTIVLIRRNVDLEKHVEEFFAIIDNHIDVVCDHLSTRWLIAICDTIVDYGSRLQSASALSVVVLVNSIKLAESERLLEQRCSTDADYAGYIENWPHELWDGVTSYQILSGDMPRNLVKRIETSLKHTPTVARIFAVIKTKLRHEENVFSRLASINQTGFWEKQNTEE